MFVYMYSALKEKIFILFSYFAFPLKNFLDRKTKSPVCVVLLKVIAVCECFPFISFLYSISFRKKQLELNNEK